MALVIGSLMLTDVGVGVVIGVVIGIDIGIGIQQHRHAYIHCLIFKCLHGQGRSEATVD